MMTVAPSVIMTSQIGPAVRDQSMLASERV